jgi:shikimate dehydrogenase
MQHYGLIGKKLSHSFSPAYFSKKFSKLNIDAGYHTFEMDSAEEMLELIARDPDLKGLNVTIPFKSDVIQYLDEIEKVAAEIGTVNTIAINRSQGKIFTRGYNTDIIGFERSLTGFLNHVYPDQALVLGTGASARTISYFLGKRGVKIMFVSRLPNHPDQMSYADLDKHNIHEFPLIINTTPVGMFPDVDQRPDIPYKYLTREHFLFDLIYNPEITGFMKQGSHYGAHVKNGLEMLEIQADESWRIWQQS